MLRSIKSQIIVALSLIIVVILGATAYLLIDQKIRELNHDIFTKALSFAELTHERVINSYENNYAQQAFANFERDLAEVFALNDDISGLSIYSYDGTSLYQNGAQATPELDRIQALLPSVKVKETGRVVYLEKSNGGFRYTNFNGREVTPIQDTEQIEDVVYPYRDPNNITRSFSINYNVSYELLNGRIQQTVLRIGAIAAVGITVALLIGYLLAYGITAPIKTLSLGAAQIGKGDFKVRIPLKSKSEVGMLAHTFNDMAEELEVSTQVMIEHEKTAKELELASKIQQELLPLHLPKVPGLDIAASLHPATQVGGDCYDFIPVENGGDLLFYIADVTGHGVGAGLVSAVSNALIPAFMEQYTDTHELIVHLNKILKQKTSPNVFVTMVMALWHHETSQLQFTQAGHDPIFHLHAQTSKVTKLAHGGMALGMIPDISKITKTEAVQIEVGDVLVLYTDGIPEAWKNERENYGMDRFVESVERCGHAATAQQIHDQILADVKGYMGMYPQQDDITLLVVKRIQ